MSVKSRLNSLERERSAALAKHRGCSDDEAVLNFLYDLCKRLETKRLNEPHGYPCPAWCSLLPLERSMLLSMREICSRPKVQKQDPWAPEILAFCDACLALPTNEAADEAPGWAFWNRDGVTPVRSLRWILQTGLGRPVMGEEVLDAIA